MLSRLIPHPIPAQMHGRRIRLLPAAAAWALLSACSPHPADDSTFGWQDCTQERFADWQLGTPPVGTQCGTLTVPLDSDQIQGQSVTLALTRRPAGDSTTRLGSLLVIPGGPGQHSLEWWDFLDPDSLDKVQRHFDLIGLAPRGIAPSTPALDCGDAGWHGDTTAQDRVAACVRHSGRDFLAYLSTADAVADVEALRRALGEEQINFLAYSYGTKVAALYVRQHPEHVRAAVLDGVVDTTEDWFAMLGGQERALQHTFARFAADCAQAADCPLAGEGTAVAQFHRLVNIIEAQNLTDRLGRPIRGDEVLAVVNENLMWPDTWPHIRQLLQDLAKGHTDAFHALTYDNPYALSVVAVPDSRHWSLFAVNCADSAPPPSRDRAGYLKNMRAVDALADYDNYRPRSEADLLDECYYWPHAGNDDLSPPPPAPAHSVLLVAQTGDPATPYANAERMAAHWRAPLLTRDSDGHTLALAGVSRCIDERVLAYLRQPENGADHTCTD